MNRLFVKKIKIGIAAFCCSATLVSCSKWDDFKKYTEGGEIVYTGKMDSVVVFGGKKRVRLIGKIKGDPKIVKARIYWNDLRDSVTFDIAPSGSVRVFDQIFAVDEGTKSFTVFTYDAAGNASVSVSSIGTVYGDLYQRSLSNRDIADAVYKTDGSLLIRWADVNSNSGIVKMQIKYMDKLSNMHDTLITSFPTGLGGALLESSLPNYKAGSSFSYRTAYLPNPTAIDTFYVDYKTHKAIDVTSLYLTNTGPFTRAANSGTGRFGNLGAPWITSANIKNHAGVGGFATDNGGSIVMEMGWGGTASFTNGKIYQAVTLPAGNYIFQVVNYNETVDPVYILAAAGTGLPDISDISSALGFTTFTPNLRADETIKFQFTLTQPQTVSLGFLATMVTGNQYWRVTSVKLYTN